MFFLEFNISQIEIKTSPLSFKILSHFLAPSCSPAVLSLSALTQLACIFMWTDIPCANYTMHWDHVVHRIPRALCNIKSTSPNINSWLFIHSYADRS